MKLFPLLVKNENQASHNWCLLDFKHFFLYESAIIQVSHVFIVLLLSGGDFSFFKHVRNNFFSEIGLFGVVRWYSDDKHYNGQTWIMISLQSLETQIMIVMD